MLMLQSQVVALVDFATREYPFTVVELLAAFGVWVTVQVGLIPAPLAPTALHDADMLVRAMLPTGIGETIPKVLLRKR